MALVCAALSGVPPATSQTGSVVARAPLPADTSAVGPAVPMREVVTEDSTEEIFAIRDFFVQGNNLLAPDRIDAILAPYIGPARHFRDIEAARTALEQAYRQLGYPTVAVTVPEQTVEYGVITLTVYEGRLKSIDVTGARFFSEGYIRKKLPSIKLGVLLHEPTVLKQLDQLNANPDLNIVPVLKPSDDPEQLKLELKAKDRPPVHGKVELNNRGVSTTPRLRLNAALQYTNLFGLDHAITVQTSQTPTDWGAIEVYTGNYLIPLGAPDHQLVFYAATASSRSRLGTSPLPVGGALDIIGNSKVAGVRYFVPFAEGGTMQHQLSLGLDYKHLGWSKADMPGAGSIVVSNPVTYTPVVIGYAGTRPDQRGLTRVSATTRGYVAGLVPQGDKEDFQGDPDNPLEKPGLRRGSSGTFVVVQGSLDRYQKLPYEFGLSARIDGQWANEPVIATEQYFAGGMESVRGYREYEAVGDHAAHATVEVATPPIPQLPGENIRRTLRGAVFYDYAHLWVLRPLPGQTDQWTLQGAGAGLRLTLSDHLRFRYDAAWALTHGPFTPAGGFYGHFSLEAVF